VGRSIPGMVLRRPIATVALVIIVTAVMAYGVTRLSTTTEFKEFLPKDSPAVITTDEFENKFGSATELILLRAENVLRAEVFRTILNLENLIMNSPEIENYAETTTSYATIVTRSVPGNLETLPDAQLEAIILNAFNGYPEMRKFVNENQTVALITISTSPGMSKNERNEKTQKFVDLVKEFDENRTEVELEVTGDLVVSNEIYGLMDRDNKVLIPAAVVLLLLILFAMFKRMSDIGISLLVVGICALWAVGTMGLLQMEFTMIHVALIPLILGLGIDYSIHMLNRYYEELEKHGKSRTAVISSVRTTGFAVVMAAVTTIIGFGSFMVSDLPAIGTLGVFAALGIGFSFLLSTCFLPALLLLRGEGSHVRKKVERGKAVDRALGRVARFSERHGKILVGVALLLAVASAVWGSSVSTEMSFKTFLPSDVPSMVAMDHLSDEFGGRYAMVVLAHGDFSDPMALREMLEVENAVLGRGETITGSLSLASRIRDVANRLYGPVPIENLTREQIDALKGMIEEKERNKLVKDNTAVIYFYVNAKSDKDMASASRAARDVIREKELTFTEMTVNGEPSVGGIPVIIGDISESISAGMMKTTVLAILLCLLVVAIAFRSIILGAITLVPLGLTVAWEFGAIKIMGWSMDILTMGISSLIIGVGIDYGIHIVCRFLEERKRSGDPAASVTSAAVSVGRALTAAAATTVGVFGILAMSRMPALMRFGTLTALLISFTFASAIVLVPSILFVWSKRRTA
jgi:hydrophobe/amphiphile efflux-3 (HAE3) family protein